MMATKISEHFTEQDLMERKIIMMIQPIDNNTVRYFYELAKKTNTDWVIDKVGNEIVIFRKI